MSHHSKDYSFINKRKKNQVARKNFDAIYRTSTNKIINFIDKK